MTSQTPAARDASMRAKALYLAIQDTPVITLTAVSLAAGYPYKYGYAILRGDKTSQKATAKMEAAFEVLHASRLAEGLAILALQDD